MPNQLLIDGHSLLFRAFHALPPLKTKDGVPSGALHGFANMLLRVVEDQKPDRVIVVFDAPHATFRHDQFTEYKANRQEAPDEFRSQVPLVQEFLSYVGIPVMAVPGFEADDVLGTLAKMGQERGYSTRIVTGDRDLLQLVEAGIEVLLTARIGISELEIMDREAVLKKMGVAPHQVPDLKGLMGDASDNIPGVAGIGQKSALKLIERYGNIDTLIEQLETLDNPRWKKALMGHEDEARRYRDLATIMTAVPIEWPEAIEPFKVSANEALLAFLDKMELNALKRRFTAKNGPVVKSLSEQRLQGSKEIPRALAVDRISLDPGRPYVMLLQDHKLWVYDIQANQMAGWPKDEILPKNGIYWGWGIKEIYRLFLQGGQSLAEMPRFVEDGKLQAHLINAERAHNEWPVIAQERGFRSVNTVEEASGVLAQMIQEQAAEVTELGLDRVYREVELPLSRVLAQMEATGIMVDRGQLEQLGRELKESIAQLEEEIFSQAGESFNINSPQQLGEILFVRIGLPTLKKTKTGFSTDAETLEALAPLHPIVEKVLLYRQLVKIRGTYVEGLLPLISDDGRLRTTFHQTVTGTGRLSSSDPNLQNIPVRLPLGRRVRSVFVPSPGRVFLAADYSQIELRMLAHLSGDQNLIRAFQDGEDIHRRTAAEIFGIPMDSVDGVWRSRAKAVNFGIVYGISDYGLARDTGVSRSDAKDYIERYFARYPRLKEYFGDVVAQARDNGYVSTILGRRRPLPDIRASNRARRQYAERMAMNTVIQGSAADLIKMAMIRIQNILQGEGWLSNMILQVHDELLWDTVPEEEKPLAELAEKEMSRALELSVPLVVEFKRGFTWEAMTPVKQEG